MVAPPHPRQPVPTPGSSLEKELFLSSYLQRQLRIGPTFEEHCALRNPDKGPPSVKKYKKKGKREFAYSSNTQHTHRATNEAVKLMNRLRKALLE